ncbi:MAG: hypothetical protein HYU41_12680 [Candidatus Rokubacteria bacterium]|nr:hypothetical protein [Candidatus Rokubacteria bacterium]
MTEHLTIRHRVLDVLRAHPAERFCTTCLSHMLDSPETSVQQVTMKLEAMPGLTRAYGSCSTCRKDRIVVGVTDRSH